MPLYEPRNEPEVNGFRLTGVSNTPVMTADNVGLNTIYLTPYTGNRIALYNGASWDTIRSGEAALTLSGRTADLPFDIFAFNSGGAVAIEFLNWSTATVRATGLVNLEGVWVKSGDATRRYVGTCRPRTATGYSWVTIGVNAPARLDLWNAANRLPTSCQTSTNANSWTYTTATWRPTQGSTLYQIEIVAGLQECVFAGRLVASSSNSDALINRDREVGIGFDSTTAPSCFSGGANADTGIILEHSAQITLQVPIGRHFFQWLEISDTGSTTTWYGDDGGIRLLSGMSGGWPC